MFFFVTMFFCLLGEELVSTALEAGIAAVLDADALSAFSDEPEGLFRLLHPGCLLTPRLGEFCRIFRDLGSELEALRAHGKADGSAGDDLRGEIVKAAAHRCGCSVLLKGTSA